MVMWGVLPYPVVSFIHAFYISGMVMNLFIQIDVDAKNSA